MGAGVSGALRSPHVASVAGVFSLSGTRARIHIWANCNE